MSEIWERMIIEERKQVASTLGLRVSDLEEQQVLLAALLESQAETVNDNPSAQQLMMEAPATNPEPMVNIVKAHTPQIVSADGVEDELYYMNRSGKETIQMPSHCTASPDLTTTMTKHHVISQSTASASTNPKEGISEEGGRWHLLPQVLVDVILVFLNDVDMLGILNMTSKSTFIVTEKVYQHYCEAVYYKQTSKRQFNLLKWNNSYKVMLVERPRLRTNGFYTLRTMYSKGYSNDAFWEEKKLESIEVKYYRHLRFFDNGRCLYSLDIVEPEHMVKLLEGGVPVPKRVYAGTYMLTSRNHVRVEVKLHYCDMVFELLLLDNDDGFQGKHNMLQLISHSSVIPSNTHRVQSYSVNYAIPVFANFRFYRVWSFHSGQWNLKYK